MRAVCRSCLILICSLMDVTCYVCVVLLRLDGDVCINRDSRLLDLVEVIFLLDAVSVALVCDWVLHAGTLSLTVGLACACCLLSILFLVIIWFLSGRSSCAIFGGFYTLGTAVGNTLGTSGVSLVMLRFIRLSTSPNGCLVCTLVIEWAMPSRCSTLVCGAGCADLVMDLLLLTAFYVSCRSCCISSAPLLTPMFLIALAQSDMAAIKVSAWVMVGFLIILWLNWAV